MRFEVDRTRDLFYRGIPLIEQMPAELQGDVELFLQGGLAILGKIERVGYNVWARRPELAKWEKGLLLVGALWRRFWEFFRVW
jgi:phytoene synthase